MSVDVHHCMFFDRRSVELPYVDAVIAYREIMRRLANRYGEPRYDTKNDVVTFDDPDKNGSASLSVLRGPNQEKGKAAFDVNYCENGSGMLLHFSRSAANNSIFKGILS